MMEWGWILARMRCGGIFLDYSYLILKCPILIVREYPGLYNPVEVLGCQPITHNPHWQLIGEKINRNSAEYHADVFNLELATCDYMRVKSRQVTECSQALLRAQSSHHGDWQLSIDSDSIFIADTI